MPRKKTSESTARIYMKNLGIYKPEFEPMIHIYGELVEQYTELTSRFVESEFAFSETTKDGTKKAPIVTTLESLRKDILSYASQLGLTPQGLLRTNAGAFAQKRSCGLSSVLGSLKKEVEE